MSRGDRGRRLGWAWLVLLGASCTPTPPATNPDAKAKPPLRIAYASDLQEALPAVVQEFRKRNPGEEISVTPGASGQLAEQVRRGAPFDVFLSANRKFVENLAAEGIIQPDSVQPYARGVLVLAVHPTAGDRIQKLADLAEPGVKRIALANPAVAPYGAAAQELLQHEGLWETLTPKIVRAESVRQALQFVESGNAEAGFVSLASASSAGVRTIALDAQKYAPIVQALGIVARSQRLETASAFCRFLTGSEGQAILARFGFQDPRPVSNPPAQATVPSSSK
jgi:molybdate transport system substrate-binding protein